MVGVAISQQTQSVKITASNEGRAVKLGVSPLQTNIELTVTPGVSFGNLVADGDYGDVVVSGVGTVWTVKDIDGGTFN